jgi:hypothetical protein
MAELPLDQEMPQGEMPVDDGTVTISITRDAEGNYTVEKESAAENAMETGTEGSPEEMTAGATKARDLNEALKITKSMFEEGDAMNAEALFAQGFGGDEMAAATPAMKPQLAKQPMM